MSHLRDLKRSATAFVQAPDGNVYKIRRIRSADLAEHAHAELVGALDADEALRAAQAEQKAELDQMRIDHIKDPEERAKAEIKREAWAKRAEEAQRTAIIRAMTKSAKTLEMHHRRIDAYCCAGIVGMAAPNHDHPANFPDGDPAIYVGRLGLSDVKEYAPVRFALTEAEEDIEAGIGWVADIDEETRGWLCGAISRFSGSASVAPFRGSA